MFPIFQAKKALSGSFKLNKIHPKPPIPNFDVTKYEELAAPGRPLIYKDTLKPVLDIDNCKRIADNFTKDGTWESPTRYNNATGKPWENQFLPLMDYCVSFGNYVLKTADGNINWSFTVK